MNRGAFPNPSSAIAAGLCLSSTSGYPPRASFISRSGDSREPVDRTSQVERLGASARIASSLAAASALRTSRSADALVHEKPNVFALGQAVSGASYPATRLSLRVSADRPRRLLTPRDDFGYSGSRTDDAGQKRLDDLFAKQEIGAQRAQSRRIDGVAP